MSTVTQAVFDRRLTDDMEQSDTATRNDIEAFNFQLLELELVDLKQQLFPQPSVFTLFHKLPTELRLKIWRRTFSSPRQIELGEVYPWRCEPRIPVSIWINVESRSETLKHYFLLDPRLLEPPFSRRPALCFDPTKDLLCMNFYNLGSTSIESVRSRLLRKNLLQAMSEQGLSFSRIHHLQIDVVAIDMATFMNDFGHGQLHLDGDDTYGAYVFHFPAVRKIAIRLLPWNMDMEATVVDLVKTFVEHHKKRFQGSKAPKVVLNLGWTSW